MSKDNALVDVVVVTYNHERFISEAIESILHQVCDFNYRVLIGEDCSTDGTRTICRSYAEKFPDKITLVEQSKNVGLVTNYKSIFDKCSAPYIAILEGDDVWTDPFKLQNQVNILKANPSCGLVHTGFDVKEHTGQIRRANLNLPREKTEGFLYEAVMRDEVAFCPLTVMFRRSLLQYVDYDFCIRNNVWTIDAFLWPEMAWRMEVKYLPEATGIYRRVLSAATSTRSPEKLVWYYQTGLAMKNYYLEKYPITDLFPNKVKEEFLKTLLKKLVDAGATELTCSYARELKVNSLSTYFFRLLAMHTSLHWVLRFYAWMLGFLSVIKQRMSKS